MPSKFKRSSRRVPHSNGFKKAGSAIAVANTALQTALAIKRLLNVEYKSIRTTFTVDPNTTGSILNLSAIAQGSDLAERTGNKVRAKMLQLSGSWAQHASATRTHGRMVIARDNNGSTTAPVFTDLFPSNTAFVGGVPKSNSPQQNSRFSILWDKYITLNDSNTLHQAFSYSLPLDHHIYFTGTGATDEGKGHLWLFIASNETTNDPIVLAASVVQYLDN